MQKDLIFLGSEGLTSTSANHIANMAKEYIQNIESIINGIIFVNSNVTIIGSKNYNVLTEGITIDTLNKIPDYLKQIAEAKSLIAWLREGIKAKDSILKDIKALSLEDYCKTHNLEMPVYPTQEEVLTEDEYTSNLSIKDRNRYYELETRCAVIGKYIHPDGYYANARKDLNNSLQHPHAISGTGRDSLLYTYTPSVSIEDVDNKFFELQTLHRAAQAELNGMKHKMDDAITLDSQTKSAKYAEELEKYNGITASLNAKLFTYKVEETKKVQETKIVIPNSLKDIYNIINKLGK